MSNLWIYDKEVGLFNVHRFSTIKHLFNEKVDLVAYYPRNMDCSFGMVIIRENMTREQAEIVMNEYIRIICEGNPLVINPDE